MMTIFFFVLVYLYGYVYTIVGWAFYSHYAMLDRLIIFLF
jgi:hypothetical protein